MALFGGKKGESKKPLADSIVGSWKLDKSGRWTTRVHPDTYVLTGWTSTSVGKVDVTITISKETGDITSKSYKAGDKELDSEELNKLRRQLTMNLGGVVLKPVTKSGKALPMKPKIYNDIAP